jgi:hypothetical protein
VRLDRAEEFAVCEWDVDGHRLVGNINLALRDYAAKAGLPLCPRLADHIIECNGDCQSMT